MLIKCMLEYVRLKFGKTLGTYGAAAAMGPTGVSSNNIGGNTWQTGVSLALVGKPTAEMSINTTKSIAAKFNGTKLLIIDEISMIGLESLYLIKERIKRALIHNAIDDNEKNNIQQSAWGGLHVILAGDFYQLGNTSNSIISNHIPHTLQMLLY